MLFYELFILHLFCIWSLHNDGYLQTWLAPIVVKCSTSRSSSVHIKTPIHWNYWNQTKVLFKIQHDYKTKFIRKIILEQKKSYVRMRWINISSYFLQFVFPKWINAILKKLQFSKLLPIYVNIFIHIFATPLVLQNTVILQYR